MAIYRLVNKYDDKDRIRYIKANFRRGLPNIKELLNKEAGHAAVIIGGGPSVSDYSKKIDELVDGGARVLVIDRMTDWCFEHLRRSPDYVVALDSNVDVVDSFPPTIEAVDLWPTYLLASQCHPSVFERLAFADTYIFNTHQEGIDTQVFLECGDLEGVQINGGGSVVLCALSIALALGMKDLHFFGMDCHVTQAAYAAGIKGNGTTDDRITVRIDDRDFITTHAYLAFAQQFFTLTMFGRDDELLDSVKMYGDSMISAMSKEDIRG